MLPKGMDSASIKMNYTCNRGLLWTELLEETELIDKLEEARSRNDTAIILFYGEELLSSSSSRMRHVAMRPRAHPCFLVLNKLIFRLAPEQPIQ